MLTKSDKVDIKGIMEEIVVKSNLALETKITQKITRLEKKVDKGFKKNHQDHETIIKFANEA